LQLYKPGDSRLAGSLLENHGRTDGWPGYADRLIVLVLDQKGVSDDVEHAGDNVWQKQEKHSLAMQVTSWAERGALPAMATAVCRCGRSPADELETMACHILLGLCDGD